MDSKAIVARDAGVEFGSSVRSVPKVWGSAGRVSLASMPVMATTRLSADMAGGLGMTKPGQALIVRFGRGLAAIVLVLTFVVIQSPAVTADTSPSTSTGYWIASTTGR